MENNEQTQSAANFSIVRAQKLSKLYSDETSARRGLGTLASYSGGTLKTASEVRKALNDAINGTSTDRLAIISKNLYATNPIYAAVVNYLSNIYSWQYKVVPHKVYTKSKAKMRKKMKNEDFQLIYNLMLEVVDSLSIPTKFPVMLSLLYTSGAVYFTTYCDETSVSIDTILLPEKFCRKVGETQFGTAIIEFNYEYFNGLNMSASDLKNYLKSFPKEFTKGYNAYKADNKKQWGLLDPRFSSALMQNEKGIPTLFYLYGSILDYEKYQDNELERNENLLKYLVVQTMPHYEDKLLFDVDEVAALHKSMRRIIDQGDKSRLITTFGDVRVEKIAESDTSENKVISNAYTSIFNNAGLNDGIFSSDSVEGLKTSLIRDKASVWPYVQSLLNFYTIAINNWFDFKEYQADIDILPISPYTYNDDIEQYRENATLGVNKMDFIIASGVKQKHIQDQLELENFLQLDKIVPMQTSYTQTAEDRKKDAEDDKSEKSDSEKKNSNSGNEPSELDEVGKKEEEVSDKKENTNDEDVANEKTSN